VGDGSDSAVSAAAAVAATGSWVGANVGVAISLALSVTVDSVGSGVASSSPDWQAAKTSKSGTNTNDRTTILR
jgi:hypothetical protein